MASSAHLVTIKRSGHDGAHFPLILSSCLFGRSTECDIRIQLPVVSKKHCKIEVKDQEAILYNFSSTNPTQVNGATIDEPVRLRHGDIITIIDRSFRYEDGSHENGSRSTEFPGKSLGKERGNAQEPARQASRDSFCADPDGKSQDAKASKTTASRRSFVHAKGLSADSPASDYSKNSVTQDSLEQNNGRSIVEPTSGDLFKKSRATGSSNKEPKASPAQSLSNNNKKESPFEKLYQSMKEELDVKSQKSCRKSEPQPDCAAEESWETQLLVSCKARAKSSGSTPVTATSSPKVGKICSKRWSSGMGPAQTSIETAKMKSPVLHSQQLKDEDSRVPGRRHSVNLDEDESAQAVHKIVTPRKLVTRNQAATEVEDVASPADTPEHSSSKKRRSIPAKVEVPSAETQKQLSLTQCLVPGEKKSPKNSFSKPEKLTTAAEQTCSGLPGLSSIDISNFDDSINKSEGIPLKRRRVSFGGHLRPELFDENLPPNTPLKRGETPTKRKSLSTHNPAVLKKIIKEQPQSPGKQESPGITPPRTNDQRRKSGRSSSGSKFLCETDIPKKAGRKSGNLPAKRASISRSQHGILQMICSKRRSGASGANLIVAKSWADVVKLGVKQAQTKVVKHVPQRQASKRQRRPSTPKKPTSNLHNQFTTGHANSPCTIVVGRAQIEKVSVPARPYKMLNNLMLNRKMDFSEDLSGLTEMFKTPVKEKQQQISDTGSVLSNSENLSERQFRVTNSGDIPEHITSEILGEKVLSSIQNAAKQQSDKYSASPTLKRRSIKHENTVQTPKNVHNITDLEKKTPVSETEPLKTASSVNKLRRSRELRHSFVESMNEKTEAVLAESTTARHLRQTFQGQEVNQQVQDRENSSQRSKESGELSEGSKKTSARRSSARKQKPTKDLLGSQRVIQTADYDEGLLSQGQGTLQNLEESMHMQNTSISDDQGITKKKENIMVVNIMVHAAEEEHWPKAPDKPTQPLEDPASLKEHLKDKPIDKGRTGVPCKSPQLTTENIKTNTKPQTSTYGNKVDMKEELSDLTKLIHMSGESRHTPNVLKLDCEDIKALEQSDDEMLTPTVTGSKRTLEKSKKKSQLLEDLTGFQERFISTVPGDLITKMPSKSQHTEPVRTPASTKRLSKTGLSKVDVIEEPSTLGKRTKSPGRAPGTPAPVQEENDCTVYMETPNQKLDFTGNSTGHKRRPRTPKNRAQPLEDLDGFQELFQTPAGASDSVTVEESAKMSLESLQAKPVRTPASKKRLSKPGLSKVDVLEESSTLGKRTKSPGQASGTPAPVQEENDCTAFMETPKKKLDFTGNSTGHKRKSRTPKNKAQPLEDLDGFQELFQTPAGASDSVTVEESAKMSLESSQAKPVRTPASTKRLSKTGLSKVDVIEESSTLGKRTKSPGRVPGTPAPVQEENDLTAFMETPKQKLESTGNLTGFKKQSRTPKAKAQYLQDITGFQESFQIPDYANDPLVVVKTKKMFSNSPQPESAITRKSIERQARASMNKIDVKEELLESEDHLQLGEGVDTLQVPNNNKVIRSHRKPAKRKLDPTARMPDSKRMRTSSKDNTPCLEVLKGFQQPFQRTSYAKDSLTTGISTMLAISPGLGPVKTDINRKSLPKIILRKIDVTEELSGPWKLSLGGAHTELVQEDNAIKAIMEIPKETLQTPAYGARLTRQPQTPKEKVQLLEDYGGFQELFQTPAGASDSVTVEESAKMSLESSQAKRVRTPASTKRLSKTGLSKVDVIEESSTLRKRTKSPGRAPGTPAPVQEENDCTVYMETPNQKLDFTGNSTGHKRRPRTPKNRAQPLEDLDGFQELFQTPAGASDSVTVEECAKMSLESSQAEPVRTPASTKRLSKTGLSKVDLREEPSTLGKRTKSPGRASGTPPPVQEENDNRAFMGTPKQKLDFAGNSLGSKRRSRIPKNRAQPLEDLDGFQELFQTPAGISDTVSVEESAKMSLKSSQAELVSTRASTKRLSKTGLNKMDVRGGHSPLSNSSCASQKVMQALTLAEDHGRETKDMKVLLAQKLDSAMYVTRGKRQQGSCNKKSQSPEDLFGLQELFQTSGHNKDSVTLDNLAKLPSLSPQPELIDTSVTSRRQVRIGLRKIHVKNELLGDIMHPKISGEIVDLPKEPEGEDKVIKTRKQSLKRKLDTEVNVSHSKRQRITRAEKTLEDLPGFQELYQVPNLVMDSVIVEKTIKVPGKSPEPVDTNSETQPRRRLRRLVVTEEPIPQRKTTRVLRQTRNTQKEPIGDSKDMEEFKESSAQKQVPTVSLTGRRKQPRTVKEKTQPLEELTSFQEETAKRMSSRSPQPEEKKTLAGLKRQPRIQLFNVGVKEGPTAQRKQPARKTRNTLKEPVGDNINVDEQKIDPVASVPVSKRPRRVPKEKAQTLELDGFKGPIQTVGHTEESASDKGPTQMPCNSLQPEQVDSLQTSPRRPRTRREKVEADEEPSAVRKTVSTSRQTMQSRKVPEIDNNGTQVSKASIKQTLDTVAKVTGSRRQLRTHKDGVQPLEVLGDSKGITQISDQSEKLAHDTSILKSTLQQKPDSVKPLRTCRRVLRASKEDPKEVLVDTRDLATLQSKSNPFLSPKRKSARDESVVRTRALRSVAPKQETTDEKHVPKKERAASSTKHGSPEPVKMKHLRIVSNKLESVEEQVSTVMETEEMEAKRENPVTADEKRPQNSRYRKKTNEKQPRPKLDASAENVGIKKTEKTLKTASQETELQNPDDGAKKSTSRGKVSGKRMCLRSRGTTEIPQPCEAEEKRSKSDAEIMIKTQKEKVSGDSDVRCLRSKKTRVALDSEPKPRVTRGSKKDAKTLKEDEDIVCTKKLRTRS